MNSVSRVFAGVVLVGLAAGAATGCSVRRETPPVELPVASAAELARDAAARDNAAVLAALDEVDRTGNTVGGNALLAVLEADFVYAHEDALGGVYVPFPVPSGEPTPEPTVSVTPAAVMPLDEAVAAARDNAFALALAAEDAETAFLYATIAMDHAIAAERVAMAGRTAAYALQLAEADETGEPLPEGTVAEDGLVSIPSVLEASMPREGDPVVPGGVSDQRLTALVLAHDEARYFYTLVASRTGSSERAEAITQAAAHEALAHDYLILLEARNGVDPRDPVYAVDPSLITTVESRREAIAGLESALADVYFDDAIGESEAGARGWLLARAFQQTLRAQFLFDEAQAALDAAAESAS